MTVISISSYDYQIRKNGWYYAREPDVRVRKEKLINTCITNSKPKKFNYKS
jgi:hypothetical protein